MVDHIVNESNETLRFRATSSLEFPDGVFDFTIERGLARMTVTRIERTTEGEPGLLAHFPQPNSSFFRWMRIPFADDPPAVVVGMI